MEPSAAETAEAAGLGVNLVWYRRARAVGCTHGECVEIVALGVHLDVYRWARRVGATHGECVEIVALGGSLYGYRLARNAGCSHATLIGAVRRHGLPAGLLNGFLDRISATPGADVATVVFETVADCSG